MVLRSKEAARMSFIELQPSKTFRNLTSLSSSQLLVEISLALNPVRFYQELTGGVQTTIGQSEL